MSHYFFLRHATAAIIAIILTGCVATWQPVKEVAYKEKSGAYSLTVPATWMMLDRGNKDLLLSHDGMSIQGITIGLKSAETFFSQSYKDKGKDLSGINDSTLSSELADYYIAELNANKIQGLTILEKQPVKVAGVRGVRIRFSFKNARGNTFQAEEQFAYTKQGFIHVSYQAASSFHWERDYANYAEVLKTLKLGV